MKRNLTGILLAILCIFPTIYTLGQTNDTVLKMGDTAPELRVEWIKGIPVKDFSDGGIYVLEFWATWCGPCKAAMPHLSELSVQYKDKVTIIGVNIWEKTKPDEAYESAYPAVKEFVANKGDKMNYNVAIEKNDKYMSTFWMKAAGQNGIPSTFLIKENRIIWIGHPAYLDSTLLDVFAGTYNMEEYAKKSAEDKVKSDALLAPLMALYTTYDKAMKANDYRLALEEVEKARPSIDSSYLFALENMKVEALLGLDIPTALELVKKLTNEYPSTKGSFGYMMANKDGLSTEAYQLSIEYLQELLSQPEVPVPMVYELIAKCYYNSDKNANAVTFMEKAIVEGEQAVREGKFDGAITTEKVNQYKETLNQYKQMN